ncbi:MAG: hypothetical protein JOZ17_14725 [Acetobacteraceae bacterium]|nr:hypothetical protein [Acetobacteraceae bacterium]
MQELSGKTAFVTGGASRIGFALGRAFAEAGMNVTLADIEAEALADAVPRRAWEHVAAQVLNAVRRDELYVFTHHSAEWRAELEEGFAAILAAKDRAAAVTRQQTPVSIDETAGAHGTRR